MSTHATPSYEPETTGSIAAERPTPTVASQCSGSPLQRLGIVLAFFAVGAAVWGFFSLFEGWEDWGLAIGIGIAAIGLFLEVIVPIHRAYIAPPWARFKKTRVGKVVAALLLPAIYLITKGKTILILLTKIKYFSTFITMGVSVVAYALTWTWAFGIGFVVLLFIHEWGHVLQLRREGIKAGLPVFIPFLGALVAMKELSKNAYAEAKVGLAGPVLGTAGCVLPIIGYFVFGGEFWLAITFVGLLLNLFNLVPMLPLDGGRAMAAVSPWVWVPGGLALIGLCLVLNNPIIIIFALLGAVEGWRKITESRRIKRNFKRRLDAGLATEADRAAFYAEEGNEAALYFNVTRSQKAKVIGTYLAVAAVCIVGMKFTYVERGLDEAYGKETVTHVETVTVVSEPGRPDVVTRSVEYR